MAKKSRGQNKNGKASPEDGSVGGPASKGKKERPAQKGSSMVEWAKSLFVAIVLFLVIRTFLVHTFVIISGSMENTLLVGDLLLVNRASVGSRIPGTPWRIPGYSALKRGDVLVFDPHHEPDMKLVKRLIGLPGDTLQMRDKVLLVNGVALEEPYVQNLNTPDDPHPMMAWQEEYVLDEDSNGSYQPTRDNWGPIVVPPEHYFMLGDNRDTSLDSRYWGFLESWRVEGRAVLVYFSYNKGSLRPFPWLREIRWGRIGDLVG
jgi:signal peptidase I